MSLKKYLMLMLENYLPITVKVFDFGLYTVKQCYRIEPHGYYLDVGIPEDILNLEVDAMFVFRDSLTVAVVLPKSNDK